MFQTFVKAFKIKEVRRKILITIALLFCYRLLCFIPIPGLQGAFEQSSLSDATYLQIMNAITGGSLQYGTLMAMGIGPYINASIIIQLLSFGIPALESLSKQGEEGRKKIAAYTRFLTIILAIVQSIGILVSFNNSGLISYNLLFGDSGFQKALAWIFIITGFTAGACLTMWLGERITDYGVSNGISMLIFTGIIATAGQYIISLVRTGIEVRNIWAIIGFVIAAVLIFAALVAVDGAERRIPVQYAKQVKGRKMYGGQSTNIPIKVNSSGVMPLIFAYSILSFPDLILNLIGKTDTWYSRNMGTGSWFYTVILCVLILFFSYFYNMMQFNPDDVSKSIQGNGGFIPGIRPGKPTADYLKRVSNRITLFGAIFLAIVALVPALIFKAIDSGTGVGLVNVFSATGLLIVVSVTLEFHQAIESQIMMKTYRGFLK